MGNNCGGKVGGICPNDFSGCLKLKSTGFYKIKVYVKMFVLTCSFHKKKKIEDFVCSISGTEFFVIVDRKVQ